MSSPPSVLTRVPRHPRAIDRPRLLSLLTRDGSAIVLVGGPGWGKTVAAAQLAAASGMRVLWCRLAPGHTDARALVDMAHVGAGAALEIESTDPLALADELLGLLEAEPTVLVIDDYHHADHREVDTLLAEVLPLLPDDALLVVASRTRPAGLVGKGGGAYTQIVDAALAFDVDEAGALFSSAALDETRAAEWVERYDGWPAALGVAAESGLGEDPDSALDLLVDRLLEGGQPSPGTAAITAAAVLPYLDPGLANTVGVDDGALDGLAQSVLVSHVGDRLYLDAAIAEVVCDRTDPELVRDLGRDGAEWLTTTDPAAAIDLLLSLDEHEQAADVLAKNLSGLGVERALVWLYEFPADLRRRFPPVVAAGRATVNLDVAAAEAARRVEEAETDAARRESLLGLGSTLAASGDLSGAAEALEGAIAAGVGDEALLGAARPLLARVRWWLGDEAGARAALASASESVATKWLEAQFSLAHGEVDDAVGFGVAAVEVADDEPDATTAPGLAAHVQAELLRSDGPPSDELISMAEEAYRVGLDAGGNDLTLGAVAQAWCLLRIDDGEGAATVCDALERRVGRQDAHARVQAALVRVAIARGQPQDHDLEREERRLRDTRRVGFASVEDLARHALPQLRTEQRGLRVELVGDGRVLTDGTEITPSAWKSKKALEVLRYLADVGSTGARREEVIEAIWPERDPEKGRTLLRTALSGIRRTIEPGRAAGEPSRFVETSGERVIVVADTDLADARRLAGAGRVTEALEILRSATTPLDDSGDWADELVRSIERERVETAERVANDAPTVAAADRIAALDVLATAEPWNREHVDGLMAAHREAGDEAAAKAVERRWFEDDAD